MTDNRSTRTHRFSNGLTLVAEPMPAKQTAAWMFLLPVGAANEPAHLSGLTSVQEGACYRGAGDLDSRQFSEALDDSDLSNAIKIENEATNQSVNLNFKLL